VKDFFSALQVYATIFEGSRVSATGGIDGDAFFDEGKVVEGIALFSEFLFWVCCVVGFSSLLEGVFCFLFCGEGFVFCIRKADNECLRFVPRVEDSGFFPFSDGVVFHSVIWEKYKGFIRGWYEDC
jgi:hypothetical protein